LSQPTAAPVQNPPRATRPLTTSSRVVPAPAPITAGRRDGTSQFLIYLFSALPLAAVAAAAPFAWGWGLSFTDIALAAAFYIVSGLGVTVGFHRLFTHGSFRANRGLKTALAVAGQLALQGPVIDWVADHRRHHAFSDRDGDPHSPWLYGTTAAALAKGFWHAHLGWIFNRNLTNQQRFTPDLLADPDINRINNSFAACTAVSLLTPALLGGLITGSWAGALSGFFWAGLVRVALLHHVTWSVNSICHLIGERPFAARDKSANFWPLALLSFGESWHNLHHADPTCARHGVLRGQIDISARLIWIFEKLGWASKVRWSSPQRLARIQATANEMGH